MITIHKIGLQHYITEEGIVDKNSGAFEYDIIRSELDDIVCEKRVLIIINGKFIKDEEKRLQCMLNDYDVKIFIASDIVALTDNISIIERCDYLLHQCPSNAIAALQNVKQHYSWVPELFYKYIICRYKVKMQKLIFGGGVRDNEDLINSYLNAVPSTAFLKTNSSDTRLKYHEYLEQLSAHEYSLIVSRQQYSEIGWVTARYVEALAVNTIPICDGQYDKSNHFISVKVFEPNDLRSVINMFNENALYRKSILRIMQIKLNETCDNFKKLIVDLIGEENGICS
jgi:hypothetical protein